jgi:hypothetical protein
MKSIVKREPFLWTDDAGKEHVAWINETDTRLWVCFG